MNCMIAAGSTHYQVVRIYVHKSILLGRMGNDHSDNFNVSNGVKQGGLISPLLFIGKLFSQL